MRNALLVTALGLVAMPVGATTVYSNNFDTENGGVTQLNYNSFNGLTVSDGTVDLVHTGDGFGITCAGGPGGCVDLDGSTSDAGLASSTAYGFNAGDAVTLSYDLAGSQRGTSTETYTVTFLFSAPTSGRFTFDTVLYGGRVRDEIFLNQTSISVTGVGFAANSGFDNLDFAFRATNAGAVSFTFQNDGGDNIGMILDNLALDVTAVPEPATWALMIGGFGLVGGALRRRETARAQPA